MEPLEGFKFTNREMLHILWHRAIATVWRPHTDHLMRVMGGILVGAVLDGRLPVERLGASFQFSVFAPDGSTYYLPTGTEFDEALAFRDRIHSGGQR